MTTGENTGIKCTQCGNQSLDEGFLENTGQGARGFSNWILGRLEYGRFGGAKMMGKPRRAIAAFRCTRCGHLELFVSTQ